jgi:DNA-binding CsgD family transcriptional regulator
VTGRLADAVRALREVIDRAEITGDGLHRASALRSLATIYGLQGSWDQALEMRIASARAHEAIGEGGEAAVEWLAVAGRHTGQSVLNSALDAVRRAGELAGAAGRIDLVVRAKGFEGNLLAMQGDPERGRALTQEALSLALGNNLSGAAAEAYRRLASVLDYASDFTGSRDAYDAAVSYCRDQGDDVNACVCLGCMSFIVYRTGEWKRALDVSREVIDDPLSTPGSSAIAHGITGLIRAARGETRPARKSLVEAQTIARRAQLTFAEIFPDFGLALLAELDGNDEEAVRLHERVLDGWRETQDRHDLVPMFTWQATYFGRLGREHELTQRAEALATMASGTGNPETMGALAHALGEVSLLSGDTGEATRQLVQALELFDRLEIPLEVAITSWRLGCALAAGGEPVGARRHLGNAVRTTRNLGARAVAALIARDLEALGAAGAADGDGGRTGGRTPHGRLGAGGREDSGSPGLPGEPTVTLTDRQREIVRLISDGLTNKEIAEKLFLSPRTVDMHVSRILDRLDCRTRTEAARKAAELGLVE